MTKYINDDDKEMRSYIDGKMLNLVKDCINRSKGNFDPRLHISDDESDIEMLNESNDDVVEKRKDLDDETTDNNSSTGSYISALPAIHKGKKSCPRFKGSYD